MSNTPVDKPAPTAVTLSALIDMFEAAGFDDKKSGVAAYVNFSFVKFFEAYRKAISQGRS